MHIHEINTNKLTLQDLHDLIRKQQQLSLSQDARERIAHCRSFLDSKMANSAEPVYGITTGFGALHNCTISHEDLSQLQYNLVRSHACGTGDEIPQEVVRLMLLLKIQALSYGNSGVSVETVERLCDFYNLGITPVVYEYGSLGASGDLAPLAHMSLPLLGEGEVYYKGKKQQTSEVYAQLGWKPVPLQSKAGLALLNGTQFMDSFGVHTLIRLSKLSRLADLIGAVSLEGFDGRISPFHPNIHQIRPHNGQISTAKRYRDLLEGSELINRHKKHVQDPYSFRCIPQVHGASKDAFNYVAGVFSTEINAVTDNPTVFPNEDLIISAGNFHGQPLAISLDFLGIAMAELGNISERRTYQLISGTRELPPFLVANPGLNSGFMIPQYTAASIVSANKQLATPASVDSIVSSNGQEDHVSMGSNAATKAYRIMNNLERILAIELFNAAQALDFRRPAKSSNAIEEFVSAYRERVKFVENDRIMYKDIDASVQFLKDVKLNIPGEDSEAIIF